ncbi:MAG: mechanosensitive ion channel domain-containing protein [Nannocystaceae bacterium]
MIDLATWLEAQSALSPIDWGKLSSTVITVLVLWLTRLLVLRIVKRRDPNIARHYHWRRVSAYVVVGLGFLMVGRIWLASFGALTTVIGLLSAGLAISLRDPVVNLAGWAFILWRRPFELGDRIEIGAFRGDVVDQRIFQFSLIETGNWVDADDRTGRVLHVPNGMVFTAVLANFSKGWFEHIWDELGVLVTFESNWKRARELLLVIAQSEDGRSAAEQVGRRLKEAAPPYLLIEAPLDPAVWVTVKDSGVMLTLRYLCPPTARRKTADTLWRSILEMIAEHDDIDLAYPTTRFYRTPH